MTHRSNNKCCEHQRTALGSNTARPLSGANQTFRNGVAMFEVTEKGARSSSSRAGRHASLIARKTRWRRNTIDNRAAVHADQPVWKSWCGLFDLTAENVIAFCEKQ